MAIRLFDYQAEAVEEMKNGFILCGGVGSGKSITSLAYYLLKVCQGEIKVEKWKADGKLKPTQYKQYRPMKYPKDLYIITTAKKRDSKEWDAECCNFCLYPDEDACGNVYGVKVTIDSWNNIKKYQKVYGAFFIFDEQRIVGSGAWVKSFLDIARKNQWMLLSATPGDQWSDYIPVFIANGFYRNKTEFNTRHCVFSRFSKYPKIERYLDERELEKQRDSILVTMKDNRNTVRHEIVVKTEYDRLWYRTVMKDRWDPFENCPIEETGKLLYLLRKVVNTDVSRLEVFGRILEEKKCIVLFYNFDYELEMLKGYLNEIDCPFAEWNGSKHQSLPMGERWVYLVQYMAGCEGWNCITTDTVVFFSQNYSYRITEQASGRIDRINTPFIDLYYYKLISAAPIDLAIRRALLNKKNFNERSFMKDGK